VSGPVPVSAGWAVWGKRPGTNEDYSILSAAAEPLSRAEYASIVAHFTPGNPPRERGRPGSLPWVTFSQVGVAGQPYLGISVLDMVSQVDGVGRPSTQTSYFCAPYADLAQPPVSCLGLYQAVADLPLPDRDGPPLRLTIASFDPPAMAASIRELGVDTVVTTASLLLDGPVTVTGAEGSTLLERLWFIDAVAALLPFAYRAGYTAATWSDNGAGQRIRLAFAGHAPAGEAAVAWRSSPALPRTDGFARRYRQRLVSVLGRKSAGDPLTELIRSLAALTGPACKFDAPRYALDILNEMDLPAVVLDAARDGTAKPDEIRLVFASGRITELPDTSRRQLLEQLIALGDPKDLTTVRHWFDRIADQGADDLFSTVAGTCHELLWSAAHGPLIREYLVMADHYGREDELLARLIALPEPARDPGRGLGAAARLLADSVFGGEPGAPGYPRTQQALRDNPAVACELLTQLAGSESGAGPAITWIEPVLGSSLRPFINVLGDTPRAADQQAIGQLAARGRGWVRALLQASSDANRLGYAVPGFAAWLAANVTEKSVPGQDAQRYWRNTIAALEPVAEDTRAGLDLCLLLTGNNPLFLLADRDDRLQYNEYLATAWQHRGTVTPAADRLVTATLADYLSREPWATGAELAAAVTELAERLTPDGRRRPLEEAVTRRLSAAPGAAGWEFAQKWLARTGPPRAGTAESLRDIPASATPAQIAESCLRAARHGAAPRKVAEALAGSGAITSGARAQAFFEAVRMPLLSEFGKDTERWLLVFIELFTDGSFGPQVATEFLDHVLTYALGQTHYQLALIRYTASGGLKKGRPVLDRDAIKDLEDVRDAVNSIIYDASPAGGQGTPRRARKQGSPS
jgi:hypothetical protein